jgi:hypothetical protein
MSRSGKALKLLRENILLQKQAQIIVSRSVIQNQY